MDMLYAALEGSLFHALDQSRKEYQTCPVDYALVVFPQRLKVVPFPKSCLS
jgi:hypothetical protein